MPSSSKLLTIIIPCFNESRSLEDLYNKVSFCAFHYPDLSFVIVENGSSDDSLDLIDKFERINSLTNIFFVRVDINRGYGYGIKSAIHHVKSPYFGWTHADGQTDIFDIIRVSNILRKRIDMPCLNNRRLCLKGSRFARPFMDQAISNTMSLIASLLYFPLLLGEINAQPSVYDSKLLDYIAQSPDDYNFDSFMFIKARRLGFVIERFPVLFPKRDFGRSSWNLGFKSKVKFMLNQLSFLTRNRFSL